MSGTYITYPSNSTTAGSVSANTIAFGVGTFNSQTPSAQGISLSSTSIFMQAASATNPGLVSSNTQTFAGVKTFNNGIDVASNAITSVLDPVSAQQAATKNYVDTQLAAFQPLESVVVASAGVDYPGLLVGNILTITATGVITIDGVNPASNARVLLKDQTTQAQNGVYVQTTIGSVGVSPIFTRAADFNTAAAVNAGSSIPVLSGTINALTAWIQTATVVTINTDALVFTKFASNPNNIPISVGTLNTAAASVNGAVIGSATLYLQAASATNPGLVSSNSQTFAGVKTFSSAPNLSSLSASAQLALDGSKNIIVSSVSLTAQVTGVLPNANMSAVALGTAAQVTGSISLTNQVVNNLPLSQTSGSASLSQMGFSALVNPMTTSGDIVIGSGSGTASRLAGSTSNSISFLAQTGAAGNSALPVWRTALPPKVTSFLTAGSSTFTPSTNPAPIYFRVVLVGAGGGGGGSGTAGGTLAGDGGSTFFGPQVSPLLLATGGSHGVINSILGGSGGLATIGSACVGLAVGGGTGSGVGADLQASEPGGGSGGASALGGGGSGSGSTNSGAGGNGVANTGGGGGGGGSYNTSVFASCGGGAGAYIDAIVTSSASSYQVSTGAAGSGGGAGASGVAGGPGGSGGAWIWEYF